MVEFSFDRDDFLREDAGRRDEDRRLDFLQRDFDQERRDLQAADELQRRDDQRRESSRAKQDLNDDDMTRIRKTLEQIPIEEMIEVINNPEVMITRRGISSQRPARRPSGRDVIRRSRQFSRANLLMGASMPKKKRKKNKKHCKNLSTCLRQANAELRTKKGKLRKGKTQADVMKRAQRLLRKMK